MIYVPAGSPLSAFLSMLVDEWSAGNVVAYDVNANGAPVVASRKSFVAGLGGAEGAVVQGFTPLPAGIDLRGSRRPRPDRGRGRP
jgi:hypothetical protein